mmetsp:Transcript_14714/g.22193  ORF Transcript_14714/g.22193 Transcript_14714/m.22193 type:complete len:104 (-) Transcript_14714:1538-1849(-)
MFIFILIVLPNSRISRNISYSILQYATTLSKDIILTHHSVEIYASNTQDTYIYKPLQTHIGPKMSTAIRESVVNRENTSRWPAITVADGWALRTLAMADVDMS